MVAYSPFSTPMPSVNESQRANQTAMVCIDWRAGSRRLAPNRPCPSSRLPVTLSAIRTRTEPGRPEAGKFMHIFISAGEPSGDLHGANLIRELRKLHPELEVSGFGGDKMAAAGCRLLFPLCSLALLGLGRVFLNLHRFVRLLVRANRFLRERRPDAVVLIDFPGFNWWVARRARAHGIPVFYFVPPQLWAWAGWRVKKMKRLVDHVLCTLPFEAPWYRERGVAAQYIGHPYFDELAEQQLNAAFVEDQQDRPGTIIGLLPGSRDQEITGNLEPLLNAAAYIHTARPDTRFMIACLHPAHRDHVREKLRESTLPIEVHVGRTPEIIHLAHSCISVSGSVGLELLYRRKPAVAVYYGNRFMTFFADSVLICRYFSLVNLLANKLLFPEFKGPDLNALKIGGPIVNWLNDRVKYEQTCDELTRLREEVLKPGACRCAARYILEMSQPLEASRRPAA
jgi:lipid-A-disaccharide synthase